MKPFSAYDQDALRAAMMKTATGPALPVTLPDGYGGKGSGVASGHKKQAERSNMTGALAYVRHHPDCRSKEVAAHLRVGVGAAQTALTRLVEAGEVRRYRNEALAKDTYLYALAEVAVPQPIKTGVTLPALPWEART